MSEYLPKWDVDDNPSVTASAAITGGQLVNAAGAPAAADDATVVGVAARDAASGETVTFFRGGVQRVTTHGALAKSDLVKSYTGGLVTKYTSGTDSADLRVGICLAAAADGATALVLFDR